MEHAPQIAARDMAMELIELACNNCGADIDIDEDARFVTCRYCKAKLEVRRTDGAAFTKVREAVERIEKSTAELKREMKRLRAENAVLKLQEELEEVDREWADERKQFAFGRDGRPATRGMANLVFGFAFVIVVGAIVLLTQWSELTFAVVFNLGIGAAMGALGYWLRQRALAHERAEKAYSARRADVEKRIGAARRRVGGRTAGGKGSPKRGKTARRRRRAAREDG
jgi:DNA-directed RNA polymerase subunit RPC12/RpoP